MSNYGESNINRLMDAFALKEPDRVPHLEELIGRRSVEYILGRKVDKPPGKWYGHSLDNLEPEDNIELSQKIGMDAIGLLLEREGKSPLSKIKGEISIDPE